jgi:hypothetical protein
LCQGLITGDCLDPSTANIIPAAARLGNPQLMNIAVFLRVKTLHQTVRQQSPRLAGQGESLFSNPLDFHAHEHKLLRMHRQLNSNCGAGSAIGATYLWNQTEKHFQAPSGAAYSFDKDGAPTGLLGFGSEDFYKDIAPAALGRKRQHFGLKIRI